MGRKTEETSHESGVSNNTNRTKRVGFVATVHKKTIESMVHARLNVSVTFR